MSAASLVDYLSEKLYSFTSKMKGDSFQPSSTSFLMSGNKLSQQYDLTSIFTEIRDKSDYQTELNPSYQFLPFLGTAAGIFNGVRQLKGVDKPNYFMNYNSKRFSPFLFNFASDSHYPQYIPFDSSSFFPQSNFQTPMKKDIFDESHIMNKKAEIVNKDKGCDPVITKSADSSHLPPKAKPVDVKENCDSSRTKRLNIELAHRKTKEMSKRSKKRRRRLKKSEQVTVNNSASASDDDDHNSVCFLSRSPDFGCTLSVTHTVQLSPRNNFFIPLTSDNESDSEWQTIDEIEISVANNVSSDKTDCKVSPTSISSPIKCKNLKPNCFKSVDCSVQISSVISFVVPEDDSSDDDDSDWDTCETVIFPENTGLEVSGLCLSDFSIPYSYFSIECNPDSTTEEDEEIMQLKTILLEANNKWNKLDTKCQKPKTASKVTFASDEDLVKVFPVEVFERKGEWERYAVERLRFRRKIDELEKIISPCLKPEHRSKIFKKLVEPKL